MMEIEIAGPGGPRTVYAYTGGKSFDAGLPCVVFVHGALHDHSVWTLLARWFANHGRGVLAVDLPGHGRSSGAPLADMEASADWLLGVLGAAGIGRASLVGHSMGSLIALEAASRDQSGRVDRLVMLATAYPMKVSQALLDTARTEPLVAIDRVNAFSHSSSGAKPSFPGPGNWLHGGNRALMRRVQQAQTTTNLFSHDFGVCNGYAGGMAAAARLRCPSTFILGSRDQMTQPRQATALAAACKADVLSIDAGHALMSEAPDAVLDALRRVL